MHELSLAGSILQMVEAAAAREHFQRAAHLRLAVGTLAGVEVGALRFALEALAPGTCLEGTQIAIDEPPGQGWCAQCQSTVPLHHRADPCPACGGHPVRPTAGTELQVVELLVQDMQETT